MSKNQINQHSKVLASSASRWQTYASLCWPMLAMPRASTCYHMLAYLANASRCQAHSLHMTWCPFFFHLVETGVKKGAHRGAQLTKVAQRCRNWCSGVPKAHSNNALGGLGHAWAIPRSLRGTTWGKHKLHGTHKLALGKPIWQQICGGCELTLGLQQNIGSRFVLELHLLKQSVKSAYGYDGRKKKIEKYTTVPSGNQWSVSKALRSAICPPARFF